MAKFKHPGRGKFDNSPARKISKLVRQGVRLNPKKASTNYLMAVSEYGSTKEQRQATKLMNTRARGAGSRPRKKG